MNSPQTPNRKRNRNGTPLTTGEPLSSFNTPSPFPPSKRRRTDLLEYNNTPASPLVGWFRGGSSHHHHNNNNNNNTRSPRTPTPLKQYTGRIPSPSPKSKRTPKTPKTPYNKRDTSGMFSPDSMMSFDDELYESESNMLEEIELEEHSSYKGTLSPSPSPSSLHKHAISRSAKADKENLHTNSPLTPRKLFGSPQRFSPSTRKHLSPITSPSNGSPRQRRKATLHQPVLISSIIVQIKRQLYIVSEFMETEKDYLSSLELFNDSFVSPFRNQCETLNINEAQVDKMFSKMKIILGVNQTLYKDLSKQVLPLLKEMRKVIESENDELSFEQLQNKVLNLLLKLCQVLENHVAAFRLYSSYINHYSSLAEQVNKMRKNNKKFDHFIKEIESRWRTQQQRKTCINSYLILPVQRLPRYVLLIQDVRKHVPSQLETNQRERITERLNSIAQDLQKVTQYCNDKKKEIEYLDRFKEIQQELGIKELVQPWRKLIKESGSKSAESTVYRLSSTGSLAACRLILFNDMFLCVSNSSLRPRKLNIMIHFSKSFAEHEKGVLCRMRKKEYQGHENVFEIVQYSIGKSLKIKCSSNEDCKDWINAISCQIEQCCHKS